MATTQKVPAKSAASKPKAPAKTAAQPKAAKPKAPAKSDYEVLLDARHAMDDAQLGVFHAIQVLESARTFVPDFETRDAAVAEAEVGLAAAREAAAEATNRFNELKYSGGRR